MDDYTDSRASKAKQKASPAKPAKLRPVIRLSREEVDDIMRQQEMAQPVPAPHTSTRAQTAPRTTTRKRNPYAAPMKPTRTSAQLVIVNYREYKSTIKRGRTPDTSLY